MRRSEAALALIRDPGSGDGPRLLARWNVSWQAFHFVGGHRHAEESFRACLVREAGEELGLAEGTDFTIAEPGLARLEYVAWSEAAGAETAYVIEVFRVALGDLAAGRIGADPDNRWLTEQEVRDGRTADGRRVSPTMTRVLDRLPPEP